MEQSYFDGGLFELICYKILGALITSITFGICYPFALCLVEKWKAKHTVICGRRLVFKGTGIGLFGNWIKWFLLCVITFGIYGFWVPIKIIGWKTKNTYFAN